MDLNTKEQILLDKIVQNTASTSLTADSLALDVSVDGLEGLQTATNTKLDTLETTLTAIETDAAAIEVLITAIDADTSNIADNTSFLRDAVYIDDADWNDGASKHMLTGGVYRSGGHTITDGDTGPFAVDSQGRLQVELSPTDNAVLDAIDAVLDTIKVDTEAIETAVESVEASITSLVKSEDAAHSSGDRGIMALAVSQTTPTRFGGDGDYSPLSTNASGALYTMNVAGQMGSILVNDTTAVTCGVTAGTFVAIYMLTDTVFASGAGGLSSAISQSLLDDTETSTNIDADAGTAIDGITFPAGMTLYGKYSGFTLASGSVIAYVG